MKRVNLHASVRGDQFDTQNFENQMRHFKSKVARSDEIPDDILEPEWEHPEQVQLNVARASEFVGDEEQYVDDVEKSDKNLWLRQRLTKGQLAQPPRDVRTQEFEDDWAPNELDNLENLPQLAEKFVTRTGQVITYDRFGDIFKENTQQALDYIALATAENERVVDQIYQTI
jgi:hypothetical protein